MPRAIQTLGWGRRPWPLLERCHARYGDMFTLRIAHEGDWVFLAHPDAIKQVFTGDPRLLHAGEANEILLPILGRQSVLLLDDGEHMGARKLLLPPFHGERMRRYGELMEAIATEEIERWPLNEPVALWERMQAITLEVIMRAVFGIAEAERLQELRGRLRQALDWTTTPKRLALLALLGPRRLEGFGPLRRTLAPVDELLIDEVRRRRDEPDLAQREDILSLLVQARHEDGRPMSDGELRDELMTLLVAGHETTATALSWALERLVHHPDKVARLREEVQAGEEEYLDAVIKETLRLRPVISIVLRELKAPMEIGGHLLPQGARVAPCIYLLHRRPDVYPDPRAFRPERFLEQPAGTYTWIPFGGGVRRCLGASFAQFEMKTVLAALFKARDLSAASPLPERAVRRAITHVPSRGAQVVVSQRRRASSRPETPVEVAA